MDQRLKYEQLIGEKLGSQAIPDMQDMIWARVQAQLDIDLPTDDNGDDVTDPESPSGPGIIGWGLSVVLIALISSFFIYKNKPVTKDTGTNQPITTRSINQPANPSTGPPLKNTEINKTNSVITKETNSIAIDQKDSAVKQDFGVIVPGAQDSVKTNNPDPLITFSPPSTPKVDTIPKKKGKGRSGLTDEDYKIVPKKD